MMKNRLVLAMLGISLMAPAFSSAQTAADREGVERAALDYLEGFYEGSTEKLSRSVHPEVLKFGFYRKNREYHRSPMTFDEMLAFARRVKDRQEFPAQDAPKRVELLDVLDQTAAVKVYAWWGSDYLNLAKYDGEWKIVQVLWQSPPGERPRDDG
jgi:Putative lumazine-binding